MPKISRTHFENEARKQGYSRGQAKRIAAKIMARPDIDYCIEQLTLGYVLTYADPTGEAAVWNVMVAALTRNTVEVLV